MALPVDLETTGSTRDSSEMMLDEGLEPEVGPLNENRGVPEPLEPVALATPLPVVEVRRVVLSPFSDEEDEMEEKEEEEEGVWEGQLLCSENHMI